MDAKLVVTLKIMAERLLKEYGDDLGSEVVSIGTINYLFSYDPRLDNGQFFILETVNFVGGINFIFQFGDEPNGVDLNGNK